MEEEELQLKSKNKQHYTSSPTKNKKKNKKTLIILIQKLVEERLIQLILLTLYQYKYTNNWRDDK